MEALVTRMASLTAESFVEAGPAVPWSDYGLAPSQATLRLTTDDGAGSVATHAIHLGRREGDLVYARRGEDPELMLLSGSLLDLALGDPARAP